MAGGEGGSRRLLPPELVALISQVELARSNWWARALRETVLLCTWLRAEPSDPAAVESDLRTNHGIKISAREVQEQITALVAAGDVVEVAANRYKVSEAAAARMVRSIEDHELTDRAAEDDFAAILADRAPGTEARSAWIIFNEDLLVPLIQQLGVRTHQFLQGKPFDLKSSALMRSFLQRFPKEIRAHIERTVLEFLDPSSRSVRAYVVDRLTTYSFVQASRWDRALLGEVLNFSNEVPSFVVFLDTNLLFSLLDLHDNPANEAARALEELRGQLDGIVDLRLYVTPDTIKEAKESLHRAEHRVQGVVMTPEVVAGTSSVPFRGLTHRFIEQAATPTGIRRPEEYFGDYADNLLTYARAHGVELFNADISAYHVDQKAIDDIEVAKEVERKRRARYRRGYVYVPKSFEQVQHDVVLWHFVSDKRPPHVESPIDAKYWVVTVDGALLGFDAVKSQAVRGRRGSIPVCLHPTALVTMLRFWVPRGDSLDSAVVRSLRLPFLTFDFDPELEQTVVRILQTVARYENSDKLSAATIAHLVASDELRHRMAPGTTREEREAALHAAFIVEEQDLRRQLQQLEAQATEAMSAEQQGNDQITTLQGEVSELRRELEALRDVDTAEPANAPPLPVPSGSSARVGLFALASAVLAAVPVGIAAILAWSYLPEKGHLAVLAFAVVTWVAASAGITSLAAKHFGLPADQEVVQRINRFHRLWWIAVVAALAVGVLGPLISDSLDNSQTHGPAPSPSATATP